MDFDRQIEDVGNILALEHVNLTLPDQSLGTLFYVNIMGFTRDPYIDFGPFNVWINLGNQQFHLPRGEPQVLRGKVGIRVPSLASLQKRLESAGKRLKETLFSYEISEQQITVTCPWGNTLHCFESQAKMQLGIAYVELNVNYQHISGIGRFYQQIMGAPVNTQENYCEVAIGREQILRFKASDEVKPYDGHHIAIYLANFSSPYNALLERGLIIEESDQHQYRFTQIVDPDTGEKLFELEHEVRSLNHPMFSRHLVNRNADQTFFTYTQGKDAYYPA
ncbi:MAG: hypothetical protein KUG79_08235 [Pseudomonadales bacterium]|nr:hypothetical protein [Pseudomonadales bacterium]